MVPDYCSIWYLITISICLTTISRLLFPSVLINIPSVSDYYFPSVMVSEAQTSRESGERGQVEPPRQSFLDHAVSGSSTRDVWFVSCCHPIRKSPISHICIRPRIHAAIQSENLHRPGCIKHAFKALHSFKTSSLVRFVSGHAFTRAISIFSEPALAAAPAD